MWGMGVLKGFGITIKNMFRPVITVQYPEQRLELPERSRWAVHQKFNEDGTPKCTACLICVKECPDHVLRVITSPKPEGGKHIDAYVYEVGACMMCGLCVAACPYDSIEMSHEYELATRDHDDLVRILLRDVDAAPMRRTPVPAPPLDAPAAADTPGPPAAQTPGAEVADA
jgi:NADH-quinone oxidoreductase subunit I